MPNTRFTFDLSDDLAKEIDEARFVTGRLNKIDLLKDMIVYYLNTVEAVREGGHIYIHIGGDQSEVQELTTPELEHARRFPMPNVGRPNSEDPDS